MVTDEQALQLVLRSSLRQRAQSVSPPDAGSLTNGALYSGRKHIGRRRAATLLGIVLVLVAMTLWAITAVTG